MKIALVLVLGCVVAANAFLFEERSRLFKNSRVNDDHVFNLGFNHNFFHGDRLQAAIGHDKAAKVGVKAANQDVLKVDFHHAKNKQFHHVDQSKTSLSIGKGHKNFIDFDAKAASSDKAAFKHDQAKKEGTHVNAKEAHDRDIFHQVGEDDFVRGF